MAAPRPCLNEIDVAVLAGGLGTRYGYRVAEIPASEPPRIGGEQSFNLLQWAAAYYLQFLIEFVRPKKPSRFKRQ